MSSTGVPIAVDRRNLKNPVGRRDPQLLRPGTSEAALRDSSRLSAILRKNISFPNVLSPFSSRQRRSPVGHMADEVEWIEFRVHVIRKRFKAQSFFFKFVDDRLLSVSRIPSIEETVERCILIGYRSFGIVTKTLSDELAVGVEVLHSFGDDGHEYTIDIELPAIGLVWLQRNVVAGVDDNLIVADLNDGIVGWHDRLVVVRFVNLNWFAIEVRIGEMVGCPTKVHQCEVVLVRVLVDTGSTTENLLELGHRADGPVKHD